MAYQEDQQVTISRLDGDVQLTNLHEICESLSVRQEMN